MAEKKVSVTESELNTLKNTVQNLTAENAELKKKLERMNELLLLAQRERFGQSSEKRSYVLPDQEQINLFNEAEQVYNLKEPEPTDETFVEAHKRKKKRTVEETTDGLPVEEVVLGLSEEEQICDTCGGKLTPIGKKFVRQELTVIPRQVKIVKYYTYSYACPECEKKSGYANIYSIKAPPALLKHSLASPATVADVMTQKYVDGVPLARQEKIWKCAGVTLSRATLANWVIQSAQTWLKPVYRQMKQELLNQDVIHADETVVQVHKEDGKSNTSESRMWVYASGRYTTKQVRFFEYQPDRSGKHPALLLRDFSGYLVTDGYAGYEKVESATRCACWAHMRRKWREAMPDGATPETSKAAVGFEYCNELFARERKIETLMPQARKTARRASEDLLLDAYWAWVEGLDPMEGSKLEDAVKYAKNQKEYLSAFMLHGAVDISNNIAENAIRPFVVGRKNWLFCDTPRGADSSAVVYTIVETAKANGLDPQSYLEVVLDNIRYLGKSPAPADVERLMPWNTTMRAEVKKK